MSAIPSCFVEFPRPRARVHGHGLADDEAISDELADRLAGVGIGDFVDFVGIEPDLALSASDDGGREALLSAKIHPGNDLSVRVGFRCWLTRFKGWESWTR